MRTRHHVALHALALAIAIVGVAIAAVVFARPHAATPLNSDKGQAQLAERVAETGVPDCHPATPAAMGACEPVQAISVVQGLAPRAYVDPAGHGVDVSSYQGCQINWAARARALTFAYFKVGEGSGWTDPCGAANARGLRSARIPAGPYYFARNNAPATLEADLFAREARTAGALQSLPGTLDYETNDGGLSPTQACQWARTFVARYEHNTDRATMLVYSSLGTWPAGYCPFPASEHVLAWDAAYGPFANALPGVGNPTIWQFSDGAVGPLPHLYGGDSDEWLGSPAQLRALAQAAPAPKPVAARFNATCRELDRITWLRHHHPARFRPHQHTRAVALRRDLAAHHVGCTRPGWQARPRSASPARPYPYPRRQGALA